MIALSLSFNFLSHMELKCYIKSVFFSAALGNFGPRPYNFPSDFKEWVYDL